MDVSNPSEYSWFTLVTIKFSVPASPTYVCFIDTMSPIEIKGFPNTLRVTIRPLFTTTVFDLIQLAKDFTSDKFCSHLDSNMTGSGFAYSASSLLTYSRVPEDPRELP